MLRHLVVHHGILFIIHDLSKTEYLFFSFIIVVYVSDTERKIIKLFLVQTLIKLSLYSILFSLLFLLIKNEMKNSNLSSRLEIKTRFQENRVQ